MNRKTKERLLVDEPAPGLALAVAQHDSGTVCDSADGVTVGIAEGIAHRFIGGGLRRATPNISKLIAQSQVIAVSESIQTRSGGFFFKAKEPAGDLAVSFLPLENASVNHAKTIMEPKPNCWDRVMALGWCSPLTYL
jgi:hypothetical protein